MNVSRAKAIILDAARNKRVKQVGSLYTSMVCSIFLGIGVSVVNTRILGPQIYGDLKFLQTLFSFAAPFLTLGFFVAGSRLLAKKENQDISRQLTGNLLALAGALSLVFCLGLFVFSFFQDQIFDNRLGQVIRVFSPLLFVYPFRMCLEAIMQGDNRIYELSVFRIGPKALYLAGAILFNLAVPLTLSSALAIQFLVLAAIIGVMIVKLNPVFSDFKKYYAIVREENRTYGFQVYIGAIVGVTSAHLAGLAVGFFTRDNTNVGYFSLAIVMTTPLTLIPSVVGTAFFKDFANQKFIPYKTARLTLGLSFLALVGFVLVIKPAVLLLYSSDYVAVIPYAYIIAIGSIAHGFGTFFNRFLGAHGRGKALRNGAIAVGIANVIGSTALVYRMGTFGAVLTRLIAGFVFVAAMLYYYWQYTREKVVKV